jgi:EAL domain-containing protein (putative c-di-GMP-specific phosphodiesterase class I)
MTAAASDRAVESTARVAHLASRAAAELVGPVMVAELQHALEHDELRLHYQPLYHLRTGELVAVEALLRWQHPVRGLLLPYEFIDVAERHPLTTPIGDWVVRAALEQASAWLGRFGGSAPRVWVNVSSEQLGQRLLPRLVEKLLAELEVPAAKFGVEVTERQLVRRLDAVAADLLDLHDLGVALAVDDFGTGYASLDYLRRFTFDEVKIDRSFISGVGRDATDTAVTASIITLGRSLGLTVVAEGVETQDQFDALLDLGCDVSQGYLLQRPAPAGVITGLLRAVAAPDLS